MNRPVHFEIHASDPKVLIDFYTELFGWSFQQWGDVEYWMVDTGKDEGGINGGLLPRPQPRPKADDAVKGFVLTIPVDECDAAVAKAVGMGAEVALPADDMPGVGRLAYLLDPDGNIFGVLEAAEMPAQM